MEPRAVLRPSPFAPSSSPSGPRPAVRPRVPFRGLSPRRVCRSGLIGLVGLTVPVVLAAVLGASAARPAAAAPSTVVDSVCDDALHHRLDVWLGDWRVVGTDGQPVGTSRVERLDGGCVVQERWETAGSEVTGEGVSYVDPADGLWKQLWVDSTGTVTRTTQVLDVAQGAPSRALRFAGTSTRLDGSTVRSRMTLSPLDDGELHVVIEHSSDGGATWQAVFDVTYVPAGAGTAPPKPAPAVEPEPAPQPQPAPAPQPQTQPQPQPESSPETPAPAPSSGSVRASSGVVPQREVPLKQRNRIFLESPMILELPIGPIESIPEEYSWSSKDTAVYVSGGVSVQKVTLSRDEHGKKVDVEATVALYSSDYLHHISLTVELVWRGEVLAQATDEDVAIGRAILAQSEGDGLEKRFDLTLDRSRFDEAFGDADERPELRLTVTGHD